MASLCLYVLGIFVTLAVTGSSVNSLPCACGYIYDPVCGSDGTTYASECLLQCARAEMSFFRRMTYKVECYGRCPCVDSTPEPTLPESCPDICPFDYKPVCGRTVGPSTYTECREYANSCVRNVAECRAKQENQNNRIINCNCEAASY